VRRQLHDPVVLPPGKVPLYTLDGRLGGTQSRFGDEEKRKFLTLPGLEPYPGSWSTKLGDILQNLYLLGCGIVQPCISLLTFRTRRENCFLHFTYVGEFLRDNTASYNSVRKTLLSERRSFTHLLRHMLVCLSRGPVSPICNKRKHNVRLQVDIITYVTLSTGSDQLPSDAIQIFHWLRANCFIHHKFNL
jgi:hypothetical protein